MVSLYEAKMQLYRQQIEELESHLSALASDHAISPQSKCIWYNYMYSCEVTHLIDIKTGDLASILTECFSSVLLSEQKHIYKNRQLE